VVGPRQVSRLGWRDSNRRASRSGDEQDAHGKLAEDALIDALNQRRAAGDSEITLDSRIIALVDQHIDRLEEDGRAVRTIDTYRYCAKLLGKIIAGVRVGEATPARLDAAIRSMRRAHGDVLAVQAKTILKGGLHLAVGRCPRGESQSRRLANAGEESAEGGYRVDG
jgi:hypothetical protein